MSNRNIPEIVDLADAVETLVATCARAQHSVEFTFAPIPPQVLETVTSQLRLTPELRSWYERAAPVTFWFWWGNQYMLHDVRDLPDSLVGYRWAEVGVDGPEWGWDPNWVVIGDWGADPIIAHIDEPGTPISMDIHGSGEWKPRRIAPSLAAYLRALSVWVDVFFVRHEGRYQNDDCTVRDDVRAEFNSEIRTVLDEHHSQWWPWE